MGRRAAVAGTGGRRGTENPATARPKHGLEVQLPGHRAKLERWSRSHARPRTKPDQLLPPGNEPTPLTAVMRGLP